MNHQVFGDKIKEIRSIEKVKGESRALYRSCLTGMQIMELLIPDEYCEERKKQNERIL